MVADGDALSCSTDYPECIKCIEFIGIFNSKSRSNYKQKYEERNSTHGEEQKMALYVGTAFSY